MKARSAPRILERTESGPGRRPMPLPLQPTYSLSELLPQRSAAHRYKVPGEVGASLARALERTLSVVERPYGRLSVSATSSLLTPPWQRVLNHLAGHGLARTLTLSLPLEKGVPLYYFDIGAHFLSHRTDGNEPTPLRYSRGFSVDYDDALSKVVGECLERGPLIYFRMAEMVRASARSLRARGTRFIEPKHLSVFAPWQVEERPELAFDDDSVFGWTHVKSLLSSEEALIPSQLIYWNYPLGFADAPEPLLRERNAHGAGGFFSLDGAVLSGLLECIQRDGFFRLWLRRMTPPRIETSSVSRPATQRLIGLAREVGLEPMFFDITSELGIPNCLCALVRSDDELPYATMGASCRLDGEAAVHDALLEAASVHHIVAQSSERFYLSPTYEHSIDPPLSTLERLRFWANPEHARHLQFFQGGESKSVTEFCRGSSSPAEAHASLERVVDVLRRHGIDAWYFRAHHEALDDLGYAAARVIVPDLVPMYYQESNAPLGHPRLRWTEREARELRPPWPHPFP
jgi:ribosomal protein S12 methylthiotransferase accessory factor